MRVLNEVRQVIAPQHWEEVVQEAARSRHELLEQDATDQDQFPEEQLVPVGPE